jgi:cbb3-type cytochrome oxidase subunit 3
MKKFATVLVAMTLTFGAISAFAFQEEKKADKMEKKGKKGKKSEEKKDEKKPA